MKKYVVSAMVVYYDTIEAENEEEAVNEFYKECPYDIDENSVDVICEDEE